MRLQVVMVVAEPVEVRELGRPAECEGICSVAVLDVDDVFGSLSAPPGKFELSWQRARSLHGELVGSRLRSGSDIVIAHGPFFTADEVGLLLAHVPAGIAVRWALLLVPFEVALARVQGDPDRGLSKDEEFLRRTHERFHAVRGQIPASHWTLETTQLTATACAAVIADQASTAEA